MAFVKCYGCDKRAAKGRMFCTMKCAALYAEELMEGNDEEYCPTCKTWEGKRQFEPELYCNHPAKGIEKG